MARSHRRRTGSRGQITARRRLVQDSEITASEEISREGSSWFFRLSVNTQVYYMKVAFGVISGLLFGLLYEIPIIRGSWWYIPLIGLISVVLIVRYSFKYTVDDLSWAKLLLLSGTFSLFISFVFTSALIWMIFYPKGYIL